MTNHKVMLDESGVSAWTELVKKGVTNAISGLSEMVGQEIVVPSLNSRHIPIRDVAELVGGPEIITTAIYLSISGAATGHMIVVFQPKTAFELIDMLLGEPASTTQELGEMEVSVLGEMGNITGSFFLNTLADETKLALRVSPPEVMMDMAGAVLDPILAEIMMEMDDALVVETTFGTSDRQINGTFLCMPSVDLQDALLSASAGGV